MAAARSRGYCGAGRGRARRRGRRRPRGWRRAGQGPRGCRTRRTRRAPPSGRRRGCSPISHGCDRRGRIVRRGQAAIVLGFFRRRQDVEPGADRDWRAAHPRIRGAPCRVVCRRRQVVGRGIGGPSHSVPRGGHGSRRWAGKGPGRPPSGVTPPLASRFWPCRTGSSCLVLTTTLPPDSPSLSRVRIPAQLLSTFSCTWLRFGCKNVS